MSPASILIGILVVIIIAYGIIFMKDVREKLNEGYSNPMITFVIGVVTDFGDALGIGSFATSTALLKFTKSIDDRVIPGTLNVGHAIPVMLQAVIFIDSVKVDFVTLITLIISSMIGSYFGAGIMSKLPKKQVKLVMGVALLCLAFILLSNNMGWIKSLGTGEAIGLYGVKLFLGNVIFLILGALMCAGVGIYAPAMATVYLMGMSPVVAFPIMMGSCAYLMSVGSVKFIKEGAYDARAALTMAFGGVIGVVFATSIVKSLDTYLVTWLVIVVVIVTSLLLLVEGYKMKTNDE